MKLNKDLPQPVKQDEKAPELVQVIIKDAKTGQEYLTDFVTPKHFSTGSVGYYYGGKMINPESGEKYQISCNITLIGSKPGK